MVAHHPNKRMSGFSINPGDIVSRDVYSLICAILCRYINVIPSEKAVIPPNELTVRTGIRVLCIDDNISLRHDDGRLLIHDRQFSADVTFDLNKIAQYLYFHSINVWIVNGYPLHVYQVTWWSGTERRIHIHSLDNLKKFQETLEIICNATEFYLV